jgi:tetratricopeptide (TPR) repeat protein
MKKSVQILFSFLFLANFIFSQNSFTYKRQLSYDKCEKCYCKKSYRYKLISNNLSVNQEKCAENDMYAEIKVRELLQGGSKGGLLAGFNAPQEGCGTDCNHKFKATDDNYETVQVNNCLSENQKQKIANEQNKQEAKINQQRLQEENANKLEQQTEEINNRKREFAINYLEKKDYASASQQINEIFTTNGKRKVWDYWCLGTCAIETTDFESALHHFKNGLKYFSNTYAYSEANDNLRIAYSNIGWNLMLKKNYLLALQYLKEGAQNYPSDLFIIGNLAHAHLLSGNYLDAKQIYMDNKGKNLNSEISWVSMVNNDFRAFKDMGISNKNFQEILDFMNETTLINQEGFSVNYLVIEDKVMFKIISSKKPLINVDMNKNKREDTKTDKRFIPQGYESVSIDYRVGDKIDYKKCITSKNCILNYFPELNSYEITIPISELNSTSNSLIQFQFKKEDKFLSIGKDFNLDAFIEALECLKSLVISNISKCDNYLQSKDQIVNLNANNYKKLYSIQLDRISHFMGEAQYRQSRGEGKNLEANSTDDNTIDAFREGYKDLKNDYNQLSNEFVNCIVHVSFSVTEGEILQKFINQGFERAYYVALTTKDQ